jgi:hypothetical protein
MSSVYEIVANKIIELLKGGIIPWQKPRGVQLFGTAPIDAVGSANFLAMSPQKPRLVSVSSASLRRPSGHQVFHDGPFA